MTQRNSNLTPRQQLIWIEQQLAPELPANNMVATFTICGPLVVDRLKAAVQRVVDQCDVLRTVFEEVEGLPRQQVLDHVPAEL